MGCVVSGEQKTAVREFSASRWEVKKNPKSLLENIFQVKANRYLGSRYAFGSLKEQVFSKEDFFEETINKIMRSNPSVAGPHLPQK